MRYILRFIHMAICLSEVIKIPDEIYRLCPYTDICNKTAVNTFMNLGITSEPCCAPCSCDDMCGLRMDCCFAELDKYKLVDNGRAVCLRPVDGDIADDFMLNNYYYMVQSCGIENLDSGSHSISDKDCLHDENGKPVIAPVSSVESGLIYINEKCAECNDVANYTIWNFYSNSVNKIWNLYYSNSVNLKNLDNLSVTETKIFIPPENVFGMNKKVCFKDFDTDKCSENDTWLSLCRNLNAPYIYDRMIYYKNVFCAACSRKIDKHVCLKPLVDDFKQKFTYVIDYKVTQMANKISVMPQDVESLYNKDRCSESSFCHDILCPEGMLNTPEGCQYNIIRWKVDLFTVQLKLQPAKEAKLSEEMLSRLNISELSDSMFWIHMACSNIDFSEVSVYNEINKNKSTPINSFVIQLRQKILTQWLELAETISSLRKCIDKQWSITVANSTYVMNASFDKYQSYIQDGQQKRKYIMHMDNETGNQEEEVRPKMFNLITKISKKSYITRNPLSSVPIGKQFFCRNIELSTSEVRFDYGEISILSKNVTLGDNEFMVKNKVGVDGNSYNVVTICIEEFIRDLHRLDVASKGSHNMFGVMALVIVLQNTFILMQISSDFLRLS